MGWRREGLLNFVVCDDYCLHRHALISRLQTMAMFPCSVFVVVVVVVFVVVVVVFVVVDVVVFAVVVVVGWLVTGHVH